MFLLSRLFSTLLLLVLFLCCWVSVWYICCCFCPWCCWRPRRCCLLFCCKLLPCCWLPYCFWRHSCFCSTHMKFLLFPLLLSSLLLLPSKLWLAFVHAVIGFPTFASIPLLLMHLSWGFFLLLVLMLVSSLLLLLASLPWLGRPFCTSCSDCCCSPCYCFCPCWCWYSWLVAFDPALDCFPNVTGVRAVTAEALSVAIIST